MRARGTTMRSIAEMRTLVGVLKDMIHRQVQLFPQATNQGCQQDSTGWGPPTFQAVPMLHPSQSQGWQFVGSYVGGVQKLDLEKFGVGNVGKVQEH